jgi:predicted CoA-binding protein
MAQTSVAVIGASKDRRKNGNKAVRTYLESDYKVFPVNPSEESIEGLKTYPRVEMIPEPVEIVSMYVPPAVGIKLLPGIAEKKPNEVWLNPGSESDDLIEAAADLKLRTIVACSMSALGVDPESVPEQ